MRRNHLLSVLLAVSPAAVRATAPAEVLPLLKDAVTAADRIALLKDDSDFVFNFLDPNNKAVSGAGGRAVSSNVANFPALMGAGLAMTIGFLGPCSLNSPHTHPRATELLIVINGTLEAGFIAENGARTVVNTVEPLQAIVLQQGSVHYQANLGCEPVMFVATLNNEDPGTLQVAQRFFGLPSDVVGPALGGLGVEQVADLAKYIPDNIIQGTDACFKKCNLPPPTKGSQPTKQQQAAAPVPTGGKAVSGGTDSGTWEHKGSANSWYGSGMEDGSSAGHGTHHSNSNPESQPPSADSATGNKPNKGKVFAVDVDEDDAVNKAKGWFNGLAGNGDRIGLLSLICLNVALVLGALIFCCFRSAKKRKLQKNGGLESMQTSTGTGVSWHSRSKSAPRPLLAGGSGARGKYAAAEFELPLDDAASSDAILPHKYSDPYDKPPSRAPSPLPPAHSGPYRD